MIKYRTYIETDKQIICKYLSKMIGGKNSKEIASNELERYLQSNEYKIFISEKESNAIGFCLCKMNAFEGADNVVEIVFLFIDEQYRNKGIATAFLQKIEKIMIRSNERTIYIKVNTKNIPAVCYWIKMGYEFEAKLNKLNKETDYYLLRKDFNRN